MRGGGRAGQDLVPRGEQLTDFTSSLYASQVYVYVTQSQHDWMGQLFNGEQGAQWRSKPFSTLALPGSHDSGMYGPLDGGLAALIQEGKHWIVWLTRRELIPLAARAQVISDMPLQTTSPPKSPAPSYATSWTCSNSSSLIRSVSSLISP